MINITCDLCGEKVDKTEKSNGFGAISIITKVSLFTSASKKLKGQDFRKQDFDICEDCCKEVLSFIKEKQKATK